MSSEDITEQAHVESNPSSVDTNVSHHSINTDNNNNKHLGNQEMIDEIMELKSNIANIINTIRDSKTVCSKYENEIQYLQEYIGTLMQSEDLKNKN
ncbi:hypothetical protein DFJ63DRAFT_175944 [Scheffersomyces coipomensis]|uniref:uncharacterized protein n=1 Tax=Scheffersomyces coipomensis TaxID=1788519 RepID=UPI00315D1983